MPSSGTLQLPPKGKTPPIPTLCIPSSPHQRHRDLGIGHVKGPIPKRSAAHSAISAFIYCRKDLGPFGKTSNTLPVTTTLPTLPFPTAHDFGPRGATTSSSTFLFFISWATTFLPAFSSSSALNTLNISPLNITSLTYSPLVHSMSIGGCATNATSTSSTSATSSTLATNTTTAPEGSATKGSGATASSGGATGVGATQKATPSFASLSFHHLVPFPTLTF
ncbi:hypothetical protein HOY82DRAFT_639368 [Tuber indicum]|nr:hypothetical protein HOY82DRAFT_639368 [Tuber indicum]